MTNANRNHMGVYLTTLAVLACTQMTPAADKSKTGSLTGKQVVTEPAIVGPRGTTMMHNAHGFVGNIEGLSQENQDFRKVVYTAKHVQLVVMALKPGEAIGAEVHPDVDQFFRVEEGSGEAILGNVHNQIHSGFAVLIPAGTKHNIVNTGKTPMKLYTLYSPPQHQNGVIQHTRAEAEQAHEHFDGVTSR